MNKTIKALISERKVIEKDIEILFLSKDKWITTIGKHHDNIRTFNQTLQKVIDLQKNEETLDLSFIKFPIFTYKNFIFKNKQNINFQSAEFFGDANFKKVKFYSNTVFRKAKFYNKAIFSYVNFSKNVVFGGAKFYNEAVFSRTEFHGQSNFRNVKFFDYTSFYNTKFFDDTIFTNAEFSKKVSFSSTKFDAKVSFNNILFSKKASFIGVKFFGTTKFNNTEFSNEAIFNGSVFNCQANFRNSNFKDLANFANISFYKLTLVNTQFKEINFLSVSGYENGHKVILNKKHFINKETARIIKAYFQKQNNITEGNKYFTIEQELYIDELNEEKYLEANKYTTRFVLYLNKYVSNFGNDWIRPLLVIFIFGFFTSLGYGFLQNGDEAINFTNSKLLLLGGFLYSIFIYYLYHKKLWVALIASIIAFFSVLMGDTHIREINNDISKLINPLNIFKNKEYFEHIAMYGMFVKVGISILIYQFIMAFRQNTRRK